MNTSHNQFDSIEKIIFDEGLRIQSLEIHPLEDKMFVYLNNNHVLNVRLSFLKDYKMQVPTLCNILNSLQTEPAFIGMI